VEAEQVVVADRPDRAVDSALARGGVEGDGVTDVGIKGMRQAGVIAAEQNP
jgi:hypothetical protein